MTGADPAIAQAVKLHRGGLGYRAIALELGKPTRWVRERLTEAGVMGLGATRQALALASRGRGGLSLYETARQAIAMAKSADEVREIADRHAALQEYARRAKDRGMEVDCAEIRILSGKRLGEMLRGVKLSAGGRPKTGPAAEPFSAGKGRPKTGPASGPVSAEMEVTLRDVGIDKNMSARAQKLAKLSDDEFERRLRDWRSHAESTRDRVSADLLREGHVNGSRAVMAARQASEDELDFYPTPPWATRALMQYAMPAIGWTGKRFDSVWEPACGEGHMAEVLAEYSDDVRASDVHDYGYGKLFDFLDPQPNRGLAMKELPSWIITNPPFKGDKAEQFTARAILLARVGVAMFVRVQFLETVGRYERLFERLPPTLLAMFSERVNLRQGYWDPDGGTATAYCWLIWVKDMAPLPPLWIPPYCRENLTRADDRARFTEHPVKRRV
jgi:hypothetical protein